MVFRCCNVCEMMEDYKEGYLMVCIYVLPRSTMNTNGETEN